MKAVLRRIYQSLVNFMPAESELKLAQDACDYWSESETCEKKKALSHWRGVGRWDDEKWYQFGETNFKMFEKLYDMSNVSKDGVRTMVEWGQGGGANAIRFARHVSTFYGVDISQPNLDECSKQLENIGYDGFCPILIQPGHPESCLDMINNRVDFFLSTAVFQHFPSKSYGIKVLKIAHQLLKEEGTALIQIRYDNLEKKFMPKKRGYKWDAAAFTSYKIDEFWKRCEEAGLHPMYISLYTNNYAYYFLKKA